MEGMTEVLNETVSGAFISEKNMATSVCLASETTVSLF